MLTGRKRKVGLFDVVDQNRGTTPLKKTRISHFAVEALSHGMIVCTHNHKVAAMSILPCVDEEVEVAISNELGDSISFKDCSNKTIVKNLKDGMILNKLVRDSLLERYGLMALDKAHKIKVFKGKKSNEEEELDGNGDDDGGDDDDDDDDDEASGDDDEELVEGDNDGEEDEDDDEDEENDDDVEGVEQSSRGPQIQSVDDDDDEDDEDGEDEDGEGGDDDDDEGDDGDDTDDDEDDGEEEEDMGTEYLVRPVGRAEDEEDASDFEPGEENGEDVEFDEDEDDDDDDDGGGKGDVLTKRKRSGEEDDGDGDERPSKR